MQEPNPVFISEPIPDTLPIKFYKDGIFAAAKERIYELVGERRGEDAQAMAEEWSV